MYKRQDLKGSIYFGGNYDKLKHVKDMHWDLLVIDVKVRIGQKVKKGDLLGCIGHSGNSFFPHLHFQLMDSDDMCSAKGIPCAFANYEVFKNGEWETITNGIPTDKDRIRF